MDCEAFEPSEGSAGSHDLDGGITVHSLDALNLLPHGVVGDVVGVVGFARWAATWREQRSRPWELPSLKAAGVDGEGRGLPPIDGLSLVLGAGARG